VFFAAFAGVAGSSDAAGPRAHFAIEVGRRNDQASAADRPGIREADARAAIPLARPGVVAGGREGNGGENGNQDEG
jgi:hypothetical protein